MNEESRDFALYLCPAAPNAAPAIAFKVVLLFASFHREVCKLDIITDFFLTICDEIEK